MAQGLHLLGIQSGHALGIIAHLHKLSENILRVDKILVGLVLVFPFLGLYIFLALSSEIFFVSVLVSD
jgi:hypothetical protein